VVDGLSMALMREIELMNCCETSEASETRKKQRRHDSDCNWCLSLALA